jgi:hypothetical protein
MAWHPVDAAHEFAPAQWIMVDPMGVPYAIVRELEIGGERGYRAVTWAARSQDRLLIGYWTTLEAACRAAHRRYLAAMSGPGFAGYPSFGLEAFTGS